MLGFEPFTWYFTTQNFSRTMPGRASSTTHKLNNGPDNSTVEKCKHSGFELSARVKCSLHQMDKETDYQKRDLRRPQVVKKAITATWQ